MDGDSELTAQVLSALLVLATVAAATRSVIRRRTLAQRVEARPDGRVWLYRSFILRMWPIMVLPPAIVWASSRITAADLGWAWPHGVGGSLLAAYYLLAVSIAGFRVRHRMRRGAVYPRRRRVVFMTPRTTRERWWVVALSLTAGITEEVLYRGALPAVGVHIYHLPYAAAASAAILFFAVAHLYQGRLGLLAAAAAGFVFTVLYAMSGSLLLPIVVHAGQDLITLLLIPAESTPTPPTEDAAQPPAGHPAQRPAEQPAAEHRTPPSPSPAPATPPAGITAPSRTVLRPQSPDGPPTIRSVVPD